MVYLDFQYFVRMFVRVKSCSLNVRYRLACVCDLCVSDSERWRKICLLVHFMCLLLCLVCVCSSYQEELCFSALVN